MEASLDLRIKQSFVLKPEHIKNIIGLLDNNIGNTSISTYCEDSINRNYNSADELLSYLNPPNSKIQSISLSSRSDDLKKSARIGFASESSNSIQFGVEGPEDVVINLKDAFIKNISMTKAWYDRFARLDIFTLIFIIGFASWVLLMMLIVIWGPDVPKTDYSSSKATALGSLIGVVTIGLLAFIGFLLSRLRTKLFPIGTFAWGDAAEKHEFLEKVRWTVVIGFIVSFLSGVVGSIIVSLR